VRLHGGACAARAGRRELARHQKCGSIINARTAAKAKKASARAGAGSAGGVSAPRGRRAALAGGTQTRGAPAAGALRERRQRHRARRWRATAG
jgi:hypothetical protein